MAILNHHLKQRLVGTLVLIALAVIFLPIIFDRPDEPRLVVDAPAPPQTPPMVPTTQEPVEVPEPLPEYQPTAQTTQEPRTTSVVGATLTKPESKLDVNSLPITWSVQVASLASLESAQVLQEKLRQQGYKAYVRSQEGWHRVLVGPFIERAQANRLRDQLARQQKLNGFLVRFEP